MATAPEGNCFPHGFANLSKRQPDHLTIDELKWSCFLGQVCGLAKMHLVCVHAAFCISAWVKYAVSGVRLSSAV